MKAIFRFITIAIALLGNFTFHNAGAQVNLITGKVIDSETGEALAFASITIKNKSIGTVSNDDGVFTFDVPSAFSADTLMVSMIGYTPFLTRVKDLTDSQISVRLKPNPIRLNEVVIHDVGLTPKEIVKRALSRINKNYPTTPYSINAFFRETHEENNKSVDLVEVAAFIEDEGYKSAAYGSRMSEKAMLKNVRSSKNYRNDIVKKSAIDRYNLLISALRCNPVKYVGANLTKKELIMDSVISSRGRQLYVIHFFTYLSRQPNFERKNTLYIDAENFAIAKYTWDEYAKKGLYSETPWSLSRTDSTFKNFRKRIATVYEYEEDNGKFYLKYFNEKCFEDIFNTVKRAVVIEMLGETTLVVTSINDSAPKIPVEKLMKSDRSLGAQVSAYDPSFWKSFNQMVPLTTKQVRDLEWEMPLEAQFKMISPASK